MANIQSIHTMKPSEESPKADTGFWLYLLSNKTPNGPLYLGEASCIKTRMQEHLEGSRRDYAHYHKLERLVYFEYWEDEEKFIARVRRVRNWPRDMRLLLIQSLNPDWDDLTSEVLESEYAQLKKA